MVRPRTGWGLEMDNEPIGQTMRRHWFWVALVIVVFFGYSYGKDRALRDNAMDDRRAVEASSAP